MKFKTILAAAAVVAVISSCGAKGEKSSQQGADSLSVKTEVVKKSSELHPSKAQKDSVSYLIGTVFGGYLKQFNFGDVNFSQVKKGINDFLAAKGQPNTPQFNAQFKISPEVIDDLFNRYLKQRFEYLSAFNREEGEKAAKDYLKKGYSQTASGLLYKIEAPGMDRKIEKLDTLEVNYKGTFVNGDVFDETTAERGPFTVIVQEGRVISGWVEGLQLVGEGGSIKLLIPSNLAYGERGTRGMEPNKTLAFDINILSVKPHAPAAE